MRRSDTSFDSNDASSSGGVLTASVSDTTPNDDVFENTDVDDIEETITVISPRFGKLDIKLTGLDIHTRQNIVDSFQIQVQPESSQTVEEKAVAVEEKNVEIITESVESAANADEEVIVSVDVPAVESGPSVEEDAVIPVEASVDQSASLYFERILSSDSTTAEVSVDSHISSSDKVDTNLDLSSQTITFGDVENKVSVESQEFGIDTNNAMSSSSSSIETHEQTTTTSFHTTTIRKEITTSRTEIVTGETTTSSKFVVGGEIEVRGEIQGVEVGENEEADIEADAGAKREIGAIQDAADANVEQSVSQVCNFFTYFSNSSHV